MVARLDYHPFVRRSAVDSFATAAGGTLLSSSASAVVWSARDLVGFRGMLGWGGRLPPLPRIFDRLQFCRRLLHQRLQAIVPSRALHHPEGLNAVGRQTHQEPRLL